MKAKATLEDYYHVWELPKELLMTSILHFREVMCSSKYTLEEKDIKFTALLTDYMRCKATEKELSFFFATKKEWEMRKSYEMLRDIKR